MGCSRCKGVGKILEKYKSIPIDCPLCGGRGTRTIVKIDVANARDLIRRCLETRDYVAVEDGPADVRRAHLTIAIGESVFNLTIDEA